MVADTKPAVSPLSAEVKLKGFKVYQVDVNSPSGHSYNRKDFYKISLNTGKYIFHYADKSFETDETILFFGNPRIPYSCEVISQTEGYACLFTEEFLKLNERSESMLRSPLFQVGGIPIFHIDNNQKQALVDLFRKMMAEQDTDYAYKDELIRSYIGLLIHETMKLQPSQTNPAEKNAAVRIASVFLELLERQFPIESSGRPLELRTAQDYASELSIHINYLNSAVKEITGKPTSVHISDRIIIEAKAMLQHTDWSISEIAYALGFEYPTYFNNFFKKKTGYVPRSIRSGHL